MTTAAEPLPCVYGHTPLFYTCMVTQTGSICYLKYNKYNNCIEYTDPYTTHS